MHFIFEAMRQRPLESKSLAIGRGITSIFMGCCFLAYVGFLIYQICTDHTLISISPKAIPETGYPSPDVEMCLPSSDFTVTACVLVAMNGHEQPLINCTRYLTVHPIKDGQYCKAFQVNDSSINFAGEGSPSSTLIRRVDIYWAVHNLTAVKLNQLSQPNLSITSFSQEFSAWRHTNDEMENQLSSPQAKAWDSLQHQQYVCSSAINESTQIYFKPSRYLYLRKNALSVIGLNNTYDEVDTIGTSQLSWGLNDLNSKQRVYGPYQGHFGFELSTRTYLSMKEQRQHSVLSALGPIGGAYGIATALYIVLFGTPRLTPFGMLHRLTGWMHNVSFIKSRLQQTTSDEHQDSVIITIPNNNNDHHHQAKEENHVINPNADTMIYQLQSENNNVVSSSSSSSTGHKHSLLESRMEELEAILREYFLNVEHLDTLRRRRQEDLLPLHHQPDLHRPHPTDDFFSIRHSSTTVPRGKSITGSEWRHSA